MKTKFLFLILVFGLKISAFSQKPAMEFIFTAENNTQYVPLDSVLIENLTQGGDTTFYAPDSVISIDYITSINNNGTFAKNSFIVSQNYPNPFKGKTEFTLHLPKKENIIITVRNLLGKELINYENILSCGNHSFIFYAGIERCYLLTVTGAQASKTIKMLNMNSKISSIEKCRISYINNNGNGISYKSQRAINDFVFSLGDELKLTAFTDVEESIIIDIPLGSKTYTFQFGGEWTPCPGISAVSDMDGNIYNTVQIGSQCWMKENLKSTTYSNGVAIPYVTDDNAWSNLITGAYTWYDNDVSWKHKYGALYNWHASDDPNGLCPTGWHIPSKEEWEVLTDFIGGTGLPFGNELKSCRQINSPLGEGCTTALHPRWNENNLNGNHGTDDWGFSGLPGGVRDSWGPYGDIGRYEDWWTSTEFDSTASWFINLGCTVGYIDHLYDNKKCGFSVRCLKD